MSEPYTIKNFENFIYGCNGILVNAELDIIKWQPHFSKELWEKNSFIANGMMKTAQRVWDGEFEENTARSLNVFENAHQSKTNIKHIIYVEKNTIIIEYLKNEINKICDRITKFKDDNNMFHADIMPKNHWFLSLWQLVFEYQNWFNDLVKPLLENLPHNQNEKETKESRDFKLYIDRDYNYRHDLKDFQKKAAIEKLQGLPNYLKFLGDAEEKYGNAKYYYSFYGDGTDTIPAKWQKYEEIINYINAEITKYLPKEETLNSTEEIKNTPQQKNLSKLSDFITDVSKYNYIMNLFVEKDYCQATTFIWKDEANGNKNLLAALLKHLHKQGYYRDNKQPTNKQIVDIAKNTFGLEISIDTVKKAKTATHVLDFIPVSPTK